MPEEITREFVPSKGDLCCVVQIVADPEEPWKWVEVTVLRNAHCNRFCWSCRLRTAWRALRWGCVEGNLCFYAHDDADRFLTRLHAAVDRVWPPSPPAGGPAT